MKEDMINIEYAITASKLKYPSLCVIDRLINLYQVDEYGSDLCDIDTLVRTNKCGEEFLSCEDCIFNGIDKKFGLGLAGCPYECVGNEDILR